MTLLNNAAGDAPNPLANRHTDSSAFCKFLIDLCEALITRVGSYSGSLYHVLCHFSIYYGPNLYKVYILGRSKDPVRLNQMRFEFGDIIVQVLLKMRGKKNGSHQYYR